MSATRPVPGDCPATERRSETQQVVRYVLALPVRVRGQRGRAAKRVRTSEAIEQVAGRCGRDRPWQQPDRARDVPPLPVSRGVDGGRAVECVNAAVSVENVARVA